MDFDAESAIESTSSPQSSSNSTNNYACSTFHDNTLHVMSSSLDNVSEKFKHHHEEVLDEFNDAETDYSNVNKS